MSSGVWTLFERNLRVESRSLGMYAGRLLFLAIVLYALWISKMTMFITQAPGLRFFSTLVMVNFFFLTLSGLNYFASAITEEKEEMMLGLLRMTGLSPLSILLGKSTTRLFWSATLIVAQVPFTIFAVTLGGVSLTQIIAGYVALLAHVFFLCNLALFFSTISPRTIVAAALTMLTVMTFFFVAPLTIAIIGILSGTPRFGAWMATPVVDVIRMMCAWANEASCFYRLQRILTTGFGGGWFGYQFWSNIALGMFFFLASWSCFERFAREQKEFAPIRFFLPKRTSRWRHWGVGRTWTNGLVWKDFHFIAGGKFAMLGKFLIYAALILWFTFLTTWGWRNFKWEAMGNVAMVVAVVFVCIELVAKSAMIFSEEARWRTLSTVAMLPISPRQLMYHKAAGMALGLLPAITFFLLGAMLSPNDLTDVIHDIFSDKGPFLATLTITVNILFLMHLVAYLSLVFKRAAAAAAVSVAAAVNLCLIGFIFIPLASIIFYGAEVVPLILYDLTLSVATVFLHLQLVPRLEKSASE